MSLLRPLLNAAVKNDSDCWAKPVRSVAANVFVFPEYAVEMELDYSRNLNTTTDSDNDEVEDDNGDNHTDTAGKNMEEYQRYIKKHPGLCDINFGDLEELEDSAENDVLFKRFHKVCCL
ncbi:unnamed protein product [Gongylonema pulchrum]|uniref:DUF3402 domain-containing protein n=1 Tax=Gongylonema pulchrum TaxID=637853 RepID=A0A183CYR1_9BILA|nr:unnamed protein product [Gongylonema pulchrum]